MPNDNDQARARMLAGANTMALNAHMQAVDEIVRDLDAPTAMGVLMMAQALTFRRLIAHRKAMTYSQKQTLLRFATKDFQAKIMQFAFEWKAPDSQVREVDSK